MLNIQEVVNFLNEHLNTNENITFNVKAEVGESDKESLIKDNGTGRFSTFANG